MMDLKEIQKYEKVIADPQTFIENFCYITTKDGQFKLLKLNKPQQKLMDIFMKLYKEKKPIRIRVLKARQMGFSTLISALGFWWATMHENRAYAVVAHKEDSASSIYEKNRIFYNSLPKAMKPMTTKFNSEKIMFDDDGKGEVRGLKSKIFFGTAGAGELFRGETITFMHKSEKAFWEDSEGKLDKSVNATVPYIPLSVIIDETTANGYNKFKDEWDASVRGENSYVPLFVGWNEIEEYKMTPPPDWEMTEKEISYQLEYELTDEQMYWRHVKIHDDFTGNLFAFQQEYPLTPEEAFIASGFSVYDHEVIKEGYKYATKPKFEYEIQSVLIKEKLLVWEEPQVTEQIEYQEKVVWSDEKQDYVYKKTDIVIGRKFLYDNYVLGIDTSGLGVDNNVIAVWKSSSKKKMVARLKIKNLKEELLARVAVEIAKMYHNALIAPEVNFSHSIVDFIVGKEHENYPNVYLTENIERIDRKSDSLKYGWLTTKKTKAPLVSSLRAYASDDPSVIPDKEFWYEAEYYLMEDVDKLIMNAASGHHDDILIGNSIGYFVACTFQAKQTFSVKNTQEDVKMNVEFKKFFGFNEKKKVVKKLRKGIYTNHA